MQAMPLLSAVGLMLLGLLLMCALAAVQMFTDVYHNVCMGPDPRTGQVRTLSTAATALGINSVG
jgi:hypothetical protein